MYDLFKEQADTFFKPFNEIANIHAKTIEEITQKQSDLMSGFWQDSVDFAQKISEQKSVDDIVKSNQDYLESVGKRWQAATEASVGLVSESNQKIGELIQSSFNMPASPVPAAKPASTAKKVSKPAASKPSTAKTASKARKPAAKKPASKKTTTSAPVEPDAGKTEE